MSQNSIKNSNAQSESLGEQKINSTISALHLEKIQEVTRRKNEINKRVLELYHLESDLKESKAEVDNFNFQVKMEARKLDQELTHAYGNVYINPETGEFTNRE